ncbi:MAG TPA: FAD-dependent monooxygenase [Acidimicrobiales bacterium]|nr:FAD-dependent monooxygenase [Acidimicrobiales bacterium]
MTGSADVVVVGGGIAGSALATALARGGLDVVVLERQTAYRDKVRGEVCLPWGAAEVKRLGLEAELLAAGGGYTTRVARYEEWLDPEEAEAHAISLDQLLPDVPGALNVGHPDACEALTQAAQVAGAEVVRGVGEVRVAGGSPAMVAYELGSVEQEVRCRMIVGADGRHSTVRRQLGIDLHETDPVTIGAGMLVDELPDWPADLNATATEDDLYLLAFPRPGARVRLYLLWSAAENQRFTGKQRQEEFLSACRFQSVPYGDAIAAARPAGPCSSYPMNDSWCDRIAVEGAVLVGDAAGWNDPVIGQGVSIALRDARMVSDVLLGQSDWLPSAFEEYATERAERLRRLRIDAQLTTALQCTFGPEGTAFRRRWSEAAGGNRLLLAPFLAGLVGPELVPSRAFSDTNVERILAL